MRVRLAVGTAASLLSAYKPCPNSRPPNLIFDIAQGTTLLAWSRATQDKAYAAQLRLRAANELEQAEQARAAVAGLNVLPGELRAQMQKED